MTRACATLGDTAAVFRAGETELLADHPQEWRVRIAIELATRTVDIQLDRHAGSPRLEDACGAAEKSACRAGRARFDPCGDQGAKLCLRARCRLARSAGRPCPAHERVVREVLVDLRERLAAVAPWILDLFAYLSERFALPRHLTRRQVPQRMAGHTGGREVCGLMARGTAERDRSLVVESADHQRRMRMLVLSLTRPVAGRMAIEASRMLKHPTGLDEERAGAVGLIAVGRKGLR